MLIIHYRSFLNAERYIFGSELRFLYPVSLAVIFILPGAFIFFCPGTIVFQLFNFVPFGIVFINPSQKESPIGIGAALFGFQAVGIIGIGIGIVFGIARLLRIGLQHISI